MKKLKTLFCAMLLSTCLVGNVFAGGTTTASSGFFSFFTDAVNAVASFFTASREECPPRQCTTCKPGDKNDPNCRPTEQ